MEPATEVVGFLTEWGQAPNQAKSKEGITTAVRANHDNVCLVVDALTTAGLLTEDQSGRFCIASGHALSENVRRVGRAIWDYDPIDEFDCQGFTLILRFAFRVAPEESQKVASRVRHNKLAFVLAAAARVLAAIACFFSMLSFFHD